MTNSPDVFTLLHTIAVLLIAAGLMFFNYWRNRRNTKVPARGRKQWLGVSRHLGLSPRDLHPERVHFTGTYRGTKLELRARSLGRDESKYRRSWEADLELNLRWLALDELKERIYIERLSTEERPSLPGFDDYFIYTEPDDPAVAEALRSESLRTALLRTGRRATRLRITKARLQIVRHHDVSGIEGFEAFVEQAVALACELNDALPPGEAATGGGVVDEAVDEVVDEGRESPATQTQTSGQPEYW